MVPFDAGSVNVVARGEGPSVFLMHGIGGSERSCAELAEILADAGYRTLCWDAPGYGASRNPVGPMDHAALAAAVLHHYDAAPAHVFGTSWGGVIATELAVRYPDLVRTLTLADSTRGSAVSTERAQAMRNRVAELELKGAAAFATERAPRLVSPHAHDTVLRAVEQDMARVRVPGYRAAVNYMASADTGTMLHRITAPALVIAGEDDIVTGVEESRLLAAAIPGAEFRLILGAGHAASQERPDRVAAHMLSFLERNEK